MSYIRTEEIKEKQRNAMYEYLKTHENAMQGRHHSGETKNKISLKAKGRKHSEETKRKIGRKGSKNAHWKGGRRILPSGYIVIYKPNHPFNVQGHVLEHRLVMEKDLGRYLTPEEVVHHKGDRYPIDSIENRQDNRLENLQLFANNAEHGKFHKKPINKFGRFI